MNRDVATTRFDYLSLSSYTENLTERIFVYILITSEALFDKILIKITKSEIEVYFKVYDILVTIL